MSSPVSVVVGEIAMQNIEEQALATYQIRLPFLSRYVDITLTAVRKGQTEEVHKHLNKQNADKKLTKEIEEYGKPPFVDCFVTSNNNCFRTSIYINRQTTTSNTILGTKQKATNKRILTEWAQIACNSNDSLANDTENLKK